MRNLAAVLFGGLLLAACGPSGSGDEYRVRVECGWGTREFYVQEYTYLYSSREAYTRDGGVIVFPADCFVYVTPLQREGE